MQRYTRHIAQHLRRVAWIVSAIILSLVTARYLFTPAYGAQLGRRSMSITSNEVGVNTAYRLNVDLVRTTTIGSIQIQFCSNNPLPDDPCVMPVGFDASQAILVDQAGQTGFSISPLTSVNNIILTRPAASAGPGQITYTFDPVKNPSAPGSYYVRVQTFASVDTTGVANDYGGIVISMTNQLAISAQVPPYLLFCTGITIANYNCANAVGNYIDFGEFSYTTANSATSQLLVATNAEQGYAISIAGTTLTSGNNIINALNPLDVSRPGTSQFGFNLRSNTTPIGGTDVNGPGASTAVAAYNTTNTYRFNPGDTIITNPVPDDVRVYTSSYVANIPKTQAPGIYVSTVTYICLANF